MCCFRIVFITNNSKKISFLKQYYEKFVFNQSASADNLVGSLVVLVLLFCLAFLYLFGDTKQPASKMSVPSLAVTSGREKYADGLDATQRWKSRRSTSGKVLHWHTRGWEPKRVCLLCLSFPLYWEQAAPYQPPLQSLSIGYLPISPSPSLPSRRQLCYCHSVSPLSFDQIAPLIHLTGLFPTCWFWSQEHQHKLNSLVHLTSLPLSSSHLATSFFFFFFLPMWGCIGCPVHSWVFPLMHESSLMGGSSRH